MTLGESQRVGTSVVAGLASLVREALRSVRADGGVPVHSHQL